ncbi:urea ABC transporter permease subunit UrtB [Alkalimarinus sediminis]|uniref:Urea ABC transporter permease subunit UrtB n=1 Tax=Alkalimarinus sediminis TaxID=1632866 RepID=A0A9E8KRM2_9ALTE|nr:urea ABC transporter permease subunit UrtB [Alkalimarinus sediminis]UZW76550.1 urea ABC transporter permease subunit UrtB [Alkalimarinus sediminis]
MFCLRTHDLAKCRSKFNFINIVILLAGIMCSSAVWSDVLFDQSIDKLLGKNFKSVTQGVELLAQSDDERAEQVLQILLAGDLYRLKKEKRLVTIKEEKGKGYLVTDVLESGKIYEVSSKRKIKRVAINNKLRTKIKAAIAQIQLTDKDPGKRSAAVISLFDVVDDNQIVLFEKMYEQEKNEKVRSLIASGIAIGNLKTGSVVEKIAAIKKLEDSLEPSVRNALQATVDSDNDKSVVAAATKALGKIDQKIDNYALMETLFFGLSLGSVLVLAAIGLAITFGVMGVINMAHGELIMLGAYTTYVIQLIMPNNIGASLFVAVPAAFLVSGLVGVAIERGVIRHLYGRPLETLLATFGLSLILQQAVRTVFSPLNRSVETPDWMSGALEINPVFSITYNRLYIIIFCLIVFAMLFFVLKKTTLGLKVRAVSQNRAMARAMGVRSEWVDALTFGLGSGVAGVAGVALSQLTNVGPNLGQAYIIDSFMVVVFGGVGNLWGTLVAGMSLGVANKVLEPVSGAVLAKILVLIFIILFIQKKPRGLFPQKGRGAEG